VNAQGRPIPARVVPWMRVKEVVVHAVDLDAGTTFADLPDDVCGALVGDVAELRSARGDGPALRLSAPDGQAWTVAGAGAPVEVRADPCALAAWLTGRAVESPPDVDGRPAPDLGPWL
jgi:maleylpyruvate isomerase